MAIDFRLAAKATSDYNDLFFRTSSAAILDDNVLRLVALPVTVPVPSPASVTQTISITTDSKMPDSYFEVYLDNASLESSATAANDYDSMSQLQVTENTLTITRLGSTPQNSIDIVLVFFEKGGGGEG